jgi:hypothetical protein
VGDDQGFIGFALRAHALGPGAVSQMRPIVFASFELLPGIFELILPVAMLE